MQISHLLYHHPYRTEMTHLESNQSIKTDAPKDNNGLGESFSPTDLVSTALASCMMTILGIQLDKRRIELINMEATVSKKMLSNPRKISTIEIDLIIELKNKENDKIKQALEEAAKECPVALSLSKDINQIVRFTWV